MKRNNKRDQSSERVALSRPVARAEESARSEQDVVRPMAAQWDRVARRAYEIWEASGHIEGCDLDNWLRAERDVAHCGPALGTSVA